MGAHIHFFNCLKRLVFMMKAFCCIFFKAFFLNSLYVQGSFFFSLAANVECVA